MSLDIGTALSEGGRRTFTRNGLLLVCAFALIGLVSTVATQTLLADFFDSFLELMRANRGTGDGEFTRRQIRTFETLFRGQTPFALSIPTAGAWGLFLLTAVFGETTTLVAIRVFVSEHTGLSRGLVRRNILVATANGIVGGIVVLVVITIGGVIGLVGLLIGGPIVAAFLAMSFLFMRQEIAVEDENFVDAMADSWTLAKGNRLSLLALVILVVITVAIAASVPPLVLGFVNSTVGVLAGILAGGVTAAFGTAVVTRAYAQLRAERDAETEPTAEWATDRPTRGV
ncbi:MAG TPA: hypothetical protein VFJ06_08545 [Halococcus sp.]|nr:hypothetical protein [Halococcus sp.]